MGGVVLRGGGRGRTVRAEADVVGLEVAMEQLEPRQRLSRASTWSAQGVWVLGVARGTFLLAY